jgi:hypothetical protein
MPLKEKGAWLSAFFVCRSAIAQAMKLLLRTFPNQAATIKSETLNEYPTHN